MAKLTEDEIKQRNATICERYATLRESQPLATATKIITYLAQEYQLTSQSVARIVREAGYDTSSTPLNEVEL